MRNARLNVFRYLHTIAHVTNNLTDEPLRRLMTNAEVDPNHLTDIFIIVFNTESLLWNTVALIFVRSIIQPHATCKTHCR